MFLNESGPVSIDFIMSPAHPLSAYISALLRGFLTLGIDCAAALEVYLIILELHNPHLCIKIICGEGC